MNVLHSSMDITDEVYSQFGDEEIRNRINRLDQTKTKQGKNLEDVFYPFHEFLEWRESRNYTIK